MGRCGVPPGWPALDLARLVDRMPGLRLDGLQAYEGHVVYTNDFQRRAELTRLALHQAVQTRELIEDDGIPIHTISAAPPQPIRSPPRSRAWGRSRRGTYATMDWRLRRALAGVRVALAVVARVISKRPGGRRPRCGAPRGSAANSPAADQGLSRGRAPSRAGRRTLRRAAGPNWRLGDVVQLMPSHACTTCNLYRDLYVHEDGRLVDVWPIEASGKLT